MRLLFVCTGNTCRSPMAAALMNKLSKDNNIDVISESAGIFAEEGNGASENAVLAMENYGIDLKGHKARQLSEKIIEQADIVLTMTEGHKMMISSYAPEKIFSLYEFIGSYGDIQDPYGGDLEEYEETASELFGALEELVEVLVE